MQANTINGIVTSVRALAALGHGGLELPSYEQFAFQEQSASPIVVKSEEMEHLKKENIR